MPVVVVTITSAVTVMPTSTSAPSNDYSSLPPGTIAGIIIGVLLGVGLLVGVVFYLLHRRNRGQFTKVANPGHDRSMSAELGGAPGLRALEPSVRERPRFGHPQQPPVSLQPLLGPVQWLPHSSPQAEAAHGPPSCADSLSPPLRRLPEIPSVDGRWSIYEDGFNPYAEIGQVVASGTIAHRGETFILNILPACKPEPEVAMERASLPGSCDFPPNDHSPPARSLSPPVTPGTYSPTAQDETPGSTPLQPRPALFINRMLKTRSKASEPISPSYRHSLDYPESRTATLDSYDHTDETRLLADAERMALRYAEESARRSQQGVSKGVPEDEDSEDEPDSPTSEYSQLSAPHDHSALLSTEPPTRHQSSRSLGRRKSSRRRARTPVLPAELPPVAEVPDTPRHLSLSASRPTSTIAHSSVEVALSHGRPSRPTSLALDQPVSFPLLTSTAFGKSNSASATSSGSTSSNFGWGSNSSGRASRYPSLAPSSIGPSSGSHPHSEGGTDWHHLPAGLAAIKNLRVEPLQNPHSPVEPPSDIPSSSNRPADLDAPKSNKRAHLREGTASSMPEVERRTVTPGGIASIDISL